jgi:phosphatidylglycerol---prolipoprotein diacylglyceryl transferase
MSFPYLSDLIRETTGIALPLPIPMFGLVVAIAVVTGLWLAGRELDRLRLAGRLGAAFNTDANSMAPRDLMSELGVIVVLSGIIGARVFSIFESFDDFLANPWGAIFSRNGFTFYGALVFGTIAGVIYIKRKTLPIRAALDSVAPSIMLGYAIGRVGCQISGDGDWGTTANMAAKPAWLPVWAWAQTYDHNIVGAVIAAPGVYPTPIYETLMGLIVFAVLWSVRKHDRTSGWLFSLFLLLSGVERFLIELIRVNATMVMFGIKVTQAELISCALVIAGLVGLVLLRNRPLLTRHSATVG